MRSSEIFGEAEKFLNFRMSRVVRGSERSGEACAARACPKNVVQDAERSGVSWTTYLYANKIPLFDVLLQKKIIKRTADFLQRPLADVGVL
jgi:nitrogenase molybdenum-iron protein alpha/beta subunit